jgi:hypothetical protein
MTNVICLTSCWDEDVNKVRLVPIFLKVKRSLTYWFTRKIVFDFQLLIFDFVAKVCYFCDRIYQKYMCYTVEEKILKKMKQARRGKIFFANDFATFGNQKACNKALERLVKQEEIIRVSRGIYAIPKKSELLGTLTPSYDDVVRAILKRDNAKVIPTGLFAENMLGLSTQVPMKVIYLTDGSPRKLIIGNMSVVFKKTSPKNLASKGKLSMLVIQALKSIRKDRITDGEIEKVVDILKKENSKHLEHDIKFAPQWIQQIMRKAIINSDI